MLLSIIGMTSIGQVHMSLIGAEVMNSTRIRGIGAGWQKHDAPLTSELIGIGR
jgi:hypothetical protein